MKEGRSPEIRRQKEKGEEVPELLGDPANGEVCDKSTVSAPIVKRWFPQTATREFGFFSVTATATRRKFTAFKKLS